MPSVVISVRLPRELKERLEKLNTNISDVVRRLLEEYVEKFEVRELRSRLRRLRNRLAGRIDPKIIAKLVREDRVGR